MKVSGGQAYGFYWDNWFHPSPLIASIPNDREPTHWLPEPEAPATTTEETQ